MIRNDYTEYTALVLVVIIIARAAACIILKQWTGLFILVFIPIIVIVANRNS